MRFFDFVSFFCVPYWLQSPIASRSAVAVLDFYTTSYTNVDMEVAGSAFLRHRGYLTAGLIPLALCFMQLTNVKHEKLAFNVYKS